MNTHQPLAELRALFRRTPALGGVMLADVACQLGDGSLLIAFPMLILEQTHDVSLSGIAFSGEILAFALLSPLAGTLADRLEQKGVMVLSNAARLLLFAALIAVLRSGLPVWCLLGVSLCLGVAASFFMPARAALMRRMLDGPDLERAIALEGTLAFLMRLVSPPLMGVLLAFCPAVVGVEADMGAYALAIVVLLLCRVNARPLEQDAAEAGGWREGWVTVIGSDALKSLLALDCTLGMVGTAAFSLTVAFLEQVLHLGAQANGWLLATTGLMGAIGTQLSVRFARLKGVYPVLTVAIALTYLMVPHATTLAALMGMWALRGVAIGALGVLINQCIAAEAPPEVMGRVQAAWNQAACVFAFIGSASTPLLLRTLGAAHSYTLCGVLLTLLAVAMVSSVAPRRARAATVERVYG